MKAQVFTKRPPDFRASVEVAGSFCEAENRFLILKRDVSRPQGQTWGIPSGKLEAGETPREAAIREVAEEVGIDIGGEGLREIGTLYIRLPQIEYSFHMFCKRFAIEPPVLLRLEEHDEARWLTVPEALKLPLIAGGIEAIQFYRSSREER